MMEKLFFLRSKHGDFCSSVSFWNKNGAGYGTDLRNLELFSLYAAQRHHNWEPKEMPLLASEVMKHAVLRVDHQYLDEDKGKPVPLNAECVIQICGRWDGNDIAFVGVKESTYNYSEAITVTFGEFCQTSKFDPEIHSVWLKSYIDTIARPTFQSKNINMQTMVKAPGIKYKKPPKPRPTSGKTRGNCATCGKLVWGYDCHVEMYCLEHKGG
jgi:hypothetical protein